MSHNVKGKFRNAEFIVTDDELEFGRRKQVHEYPLRDEPYVEDLGKNARKFSIEVQVLGDKYETDRDRLIDALELPGPGILVHPDFGTMTVSIISARMSQSNRTRRKVSFSITFIPGKATPRYPTSSNDTSSSVSAQADKSLADMIDDFANNFSVVGLMADQVSKIETELDNTITAVDNLIGSVTSPMSSLIRTPANLGSALVGAVSKIGTTITDPLRALNLYSRLFNVGDDSPSTPTTTASRKQQATSTTAMYNLVKRAALIESCRASSQVNYATYNDALVIQDLLLNETDKQMESDGVSDIVYQSLIILRVTVVDDIRTRGMKLSRLKTYVSLSMQPALVVAHQLYGDATRETDVVERNNIRHPGFIQGGRALEVLIDV